MPNRRFEPTSAARPATLPVPGGLRLRHVLLLFLLCGVAWQLAPRAQAAWVLRERATQLADYALCMVGPTGPSGLRDQPAAFWELVRRRLLESEPEEAPFSACAALASELSDSKEIAAAHQAAAEQFIEYGGSATVAVRQGRRRLGDPDVANLEQLEVSTQLLSRLAAAAWPFEQKGYTHLVRPSSHAREAAHPAEFPRAGSGSGLPDFRSLYRTTWTDGARWYLAQGHAANLALYESLDFGRTFRPVRLDRPGVGRYAGRCSTHGARNAFTFELTADALLVHSWLGDAMQHTSRLSSQSVVATACDEETALIALRGEDDAQRVVLCRHAGACGVMPVDASWLSRGFDIARLSGVSVLASIDYGIVRIRSSRDNGAHWTPATIAFDWHGEADPSLPVPTRLLALGNRLLLHGDAKHGQSYPLLVSDDFGASWRAPVDASVVAESAAGVSAR